MKNIWNQHLVIHIDSTCFRFTWDLLHSLARTEKPLTKRPKLLQKGNSPSNHWLSGLNSLLFSQKWTCLFHHEISSGHKRQGNKGFLPRNDRSQQIRFSETYLRTIMWNGFIHGGDDPSWCGRETEGSFGIGWIKLKLVTIWHTSLLLPWKFDIPKSDGF